ncbi:putative phage tail protein [Gluconobacter oxydans]|uniref:putative phage tail protein n=1 Tax=Gluconobacter oxydans TaxID=442 RepID=UPI003464D063
MRTAQEIQQEWLTQLLPSGAAWPKETDSNLGKLLLALATPRAQLEEDILSLRWEISPKTSTLLLDDYKDVLGADPAGRDQGNLTTAQWQALLYARWTTRGGQSIAYYEALAAALGVTLSIYEPVAAVYGAFSYGDGTVYSTPDYDNFVWVVTLPRVGTGLEALIQENQPADADVVFRYESDGGFGTYQFDQIAFGG